MHKRSYRRAILFFVLASALVPCHAARALDAGYYNTQGLDLYRSGDYADAVEEFERAKALYYGMAGWDGNGIPTRAKLEELALGWVADELEP